MTTRDRTDPAEEEGVEQKEQEVEVTRADTPAVTENPDEIEKPKPPTAEELLKAEKSWLMNEIQILINSQINQERQNKNL